MNGFDNIDTDIYRIARERYLPKKIKYLFVAESPPAYKGKTPKSYFYFDNVPKADLLFYTVVKAIYDLDFEKDKHDRSAVLSQFRDDGHYLIDAVEYPINKTIEEGSVINADREKIIASNIMKFEQGIRSLIGRGHVDNYTKTILIKETVFNVYAKHKLLTVLNSRFIGFPRWVKDERTIELIRKILKMS